ncbi:MAG: FecR domain-containing protein, partial [Bdellovibrio sp.]|nr:FecR domain-containing protein [Bdellovibrio sp.]
MKNQWKRLLIAAISSSSVFALTWYWYQSTDSRQNVHGNEKPLAYVGKVVDDIQRRPAARLLWQLVNTGEPLYNGEAIRTSERGEVRIQFTDSDRYLDLEPESLIVIKKSEGEIALDLMEGSLFVAAKAAGESADAPGLVLNSANGKVDLSQASASLSKGSGNSVDVQVLEGKASIKSKDGQSKELSSGSFGALGARGLEFDNSNLRVLSPLPHKPVAMDAEDLRPIPFKWTGFPAEAQVSLWVGRTRRELKEFSKATVGQSELNVKMPFGRHYWKLVAQNPDGKVLGESPVYKTEVLARYAPTVVFPTADAEVPANTSPFDMAFKWQKGDDTRQVSLEVWSDENMTQKVAAKSFTAEESYT